VINFGLGLTQNDLDSLENYLEFDSVSGDTTISIDAEGSSGTFESTQQILDNLLDNSNLIID